MRVSAAKAEFRTDRPGSGEEGFTLVEMMVAMVVLGVVLTAAFATVSQSLRTVELSRDYARVAQILQSEMEDLRTMNWSALEAQQVADSGVVSIDLETEFNEAFGSRYRAFRFIDDRHSDQKQATIWVYWWDSDNVFHMKQSVSWFTQNGLNDYYYRSF